MEDKLIAQIGMREGWGNDTPFGLTPADRRQHLYVVGKTGTGKTTLLRNLILQDIEAGRGVAVVDPHGDLADGLLDFIPRHRTEDVVYFNPSDLDHAIGINLLENVPPDSRHLIASGIVSAFKDIWADSWGPRLEYILYAAVAALLECQNVSLLGLQRMFFDKRYRAWVVKQVNDPIVRSFWLHEFESYGRTLLHEAIAPIQNKIGQLLMAPQLRNVLGQVRSRIDARFVMDNSRIFIAELSKGRLGADKASLLGSLLVTQFQVAALSRAEVPEDKRRDFFLYADEFHSFTSESFGHMLSEARKYGLCLTLSHQYVNQLRESVRDAVFGNVGSMILFRVGHPDASVLEQELGGAYTAAHLAELGNHEVCAKLLLGGVHGSPFLGKTLAPLGTRHGRRDTIVQRSREKYATRREVVENRIRRWMRT